MPFVRVTRDRRGYEYIYLLHADRDPSSRPQMLYWFRTPPNLKVGRSPFDEDLRRTLAARHPEIAFDWAALSELPPLPPDPEPWRERRRLARLMRESAMEIDAEEDVPEPGDEMIATDVQALDAGPDEVVEVVEAVEPDTTSQIAPVDGASGARRRRRRRGRNRHSSNSASESPAAPSGHRNRP